MRGTGLDRRQGLLAVVVGGSGAGKDTVMRAARPLLPEATFVRRVITRPREPNEDHEPATLYGFAAQEREGCFAVIWRAHGLRYAIPTEARAAVEQGTLAIVNGSRRALPDIEAAFARIAVFEITASAATRARRLAARGREESAEIKRRLPQRS